MQNDHQNYTQNNQTLDSQPAEYAGLSLIKTLIVLIVIASISAAAIYYLKSNKPEAKKSGPKQSIVSINASKVDTRDYTVLISSNGSISAKTSTTLVAQISGEITQISNKFASGASFKKGDLLLAIDQRNFVAAASSAKAALAQSEATLETERANADQAKKDWERLGFEGEPNARVLRKPQLDAAKAQYHAALSSYNKAKLDLSRTQIRAPYDGSVINKEVGLGQFVAIGTPIGNIFSSQGLEISLPINQEEYAQLDLSGQADVILFADLGGARHEWQGKLVRADQAFNVNTRQLNVTVDIKEVFSNKGLELKIGQYLNASIAGRKIEQAKVIPNSAVREGSYVFIFDDGVLRRQNIDIVWQDDDNTIVSQISENTLVVTTSLGGAVSGSKAKLIGQKREKKSTKGTVDTAENTETLKPEGNN